MSADNAVNQNNVSVTYEKGNFFRVIHADGCFGGITPRGLLNMAFFSERSPIPQVAEFDIVNGVPSAERTVQTKSGLFREVECDVFMDLTSAVGMHAWLGEKLEAAKVQLNISDADWNRLKGRAP